jgi:hypothetical protein
MLWRTYVQHAIPTMTPRRFARYPGSASLLRHGVTARKRCALVGSGRGGTMATEAYCVKCREKREMQDEKEVTFDNGRRAMQGTCPVCGTKMTRILPSKK